MSDSEIANDKRPIKSIWIDDIDKTQWVVGQAEIEKIESYLEPGDCSLTVWFRIWRDGKISNRVHASNIFGGIFYQNT